MPFQWFIQPFYTLLRFIMQRDIPAEMRVFSKATDPTNASSLLASLKENHYFLNDGLGNIIVTQVKYCKCRLSKGSPWEHEFLLVTLKESVRSKRTAFLMVERLMDETSEYPGGRDGLLADIDKHQSEEMNTIEGADSNPSSSSSTESSTTTSLAAPMWHTSSHAHSSAAKVKRTTKGDAPDACDRLVIFPNKEAFAREMKNYPFNILMIMDLTQSQKVTLERFALLLRTTSKNTPQYHVIFGGYTVHQI